MCIHPHTRQFKFELNPFVLLLLVRLEGEEGRVVYQATKSSCQNLSELTGRRGDGRPAAQTDWLEEKVHAAFSFMNYNSIQ